MNIEHISISRAGTWEECKQRYKFRYHLKMPAPGEEPFYFIYGKIVHKIAEEYVSQRGAKTLSEISTAVLNGEIEVDEGVKAAKLPPEYQNRLPSHLRAIESLTKQIGFGGELELPFNLDLDPPHGKMIAGVIDRLIKKDKCFIIDYKTTKRGKWRKTPDTIRKDLQLRAYAWAVNQIYKIDYDNIRGALYYLEGGNLIPVKFNEASVQTAVKELVSVYDEIKNYDPNTVIGTTGDHCARCDYRTVCPFYKLKGRR